jgi:hypothetical protein
MPLLSNPSAAVLYPGKVPYALPYASGARLYVIAHVHLAFVAMLALLCSWGISPAGSGIGALAYAFGAPVLSQHGNVIFLVGAASAPLGLRAVDRLVRLKRRGRPWSWRRCWHSRCWAVIPRPLTWSCSAAASTPSG